MRYSIKKLKTNVGFTLAETLMTVLILLMVAGVVAGGVPAAVRAYSKAIDAANAQVLLSTTVNALRSKLATAWDVQVNNNEVTYIDSATGAQAKLFLDEKGVITVKDFVSFGGNGQEYSLVSEKATTNSLKVTFGGVDWYSEDSEEGAGGTGGTGGTDTKDVLCFTGIKVTKKDEYDPIAEIDLYIRPLTGKLAIPGSA